MQEYIDKSIGGGGTIRPTGRRPELDSLPVRSFIIMEAKIMKMAKKFLAVSSLAGITPSDYGLDVIPAAAFFWTASFRPFCQRFAADIEDMGCLRRAE